MDQSSKVRLGSAFAFFINLLVSYFVVRGHHHPPLIPIIRLQEGHVVDVCVAVLKNDFTNFLLIIKDLLKRIASLERVPYLSVVHIVL